MISLKKNVKEATKNGTELKMDHEEEQLINWKH